MAAARLDRYPLRTSAPAARDGGPGGGPCCSPYGVGPPILGRIDRQIFHALNDLLLGHPLIAHGVEDFSFWSVPVLAAATLGLCLLGRPGLVSRWRIASLSALTSASLGLLVAQVVSHIWARPRPTVAHPGDAHLFFVAPSGDPSFPSDHATAAFAIAFTVFFVSRRVGIAFLVTAAAVALARVLIGLHYPGDIAAGALIGLGSATVVHVVARRPLIAVVTLVGRITDPLLRPLWRRRDTAAR